MARTRRPWSALRADIYTHLKESESKSFYPPEDVLVYFNEEKDHLEMQLSDNNEGFSTEVHTADIVADQAEYSILEYGGRLKKIERVYPDLKRKIPLVRSERMSTPLFTEGVGLLAVPTYRLIGNFIILEPTPGEAEVGGLEIEMEIASDRIESDSDEIPLDWPLFAETLLVLRTAQAALDAEESQDTEGQMTSGFMRRLTRYERMFEAYSERRSFGRTFAVPHRQGG